jgi:hypothetical protein
MGGCGCGLERGVDRWMVGLVVDEDGEFEMFGNNFLGYIL